MKNILFFLIMPLSLAMFSQTQIGLDIEGETAGDESGKSVSLSADGSIVAIGSPFNNDNGENSGHVRVYKNENNTWMQIGDDIEGDIEDSTSGASLSLSADGNIVAIGSPYNDDNGTNSGQVNIYKNENNTWIQIGDDIKGERQNDRLGTSVSLSADGSIVAIGAPFNYGDGPNNSGEVSIYKNENNTWVQIGNTIGGEGTGNQSGRSVSLSSDGSVVAIGAPLNNGNSGHVRVYKNENDTWLQIGNDIDGEAAGDASGISVSLSSDGNTVAIGASQNDDNGSNSGHVRVYKNENDTWLQIGNDIDGELAGDESGLSVSLSSDGSIVAIGAPFNDDSAITSGHVRVYKNTNNQWVQLGSDIDGEFENDESGTSVSLSGDGSIVAIGAPVNAFYAGHVRVYNVSNTLSNETIAANDFNIYPNPAQHVVKIKLQPNQILQLVNMYTVDGKYLYTQHHLELNLSNLNKGVYVLEVLTKESKHIKKLVKN